MAKTSGQMIQGKGRTKLRTNENLTSEIFEVRHYPLDKVGEVQRKFEEKKSQQPYYCVRVNTMVLKKIRYIIEWIDQYKQIATEN